MKPLLLDPLFKNITVLTGIGAKNAKYFEKLIKSGKIIDLLWHLPIDFIDRRYTPKIMEAPDGKIATIKVIVDKHYPNSRKSVPYKVKVMDNTGFMDIIFFHPIKDYIEKSLPVGEEVLISGKIEKFRGKTQMTHPGYMLFPQKIEELPYIEPVYPLTGGLSNKVLRKVIKEALKIIPELPEWLNTELKKKKSWESWKKSLTDCHMPKGINYIEPEHSSRSRLAYDELLANQLALAIIRHKQRDLYGRSFAGSGILRNKILESLPFELTNAQKNALKEIKKDMAEPLRMIRLLQGDVGSGKTIVACLAMIQAVESGVQAAIMAPTEILARQHAESFKDFLDKAGIKFVIITGRDKGKKREILKQQIANGDAQIVIGTHALFSEDIKFKDLGLVVIDEQHRFGVHQRLALSGKGVSTDILVMTATPIPRTLTLTAYGDMDVSRLNEKPAGRKPIDTRLISQEKIEEIIEGIKRQIDKGSRVFWVCPLVEESEKIDLAAAQERYEILQARFGKRVGIVHGQMKSDEKDTVMEKFAKGDIDIIVATTVIEVGVNVPQATIMIIEHAERFGLAQLHQLRGRVGRSSEQSYCFLIYSLPLSENAKERLSIMRDTEDGFIIAEKDLQLRGGGEILGTKQSGIPEFKVADIVAHSDLLQIARDDARLIISKDPDLKSERGKALRCLLYLFEYDKAIENLKSG